MTDQLLEVSRRILAWRANDPQADPSIAAQIRTPYLEAYLSREPTTLQKSDLLWQLYVRTGRYPAAAAVLASLADTAA